MCIAAILAPLLVSQPFEALRADAAWCGPRIVYFFAWYHGFECELEDVVEVCGTDADGMTSMASLVRAADNQGLEPTPLRCTLDELLRFGGPAIVCLRHPDRATGPVHFVGFVASSDDRAFLVLMDPSRSMGLMLVHRKAIARLFTGEVVLLKGCDKPPVYPHWLPSGRRLQLGTAAALMVCTIVVLRRRHARR